MCRSTRTLVIALAALVVLIGLAASVPVPVVALGPGPTFNTLGVVNGHPVVTVTGRPVFPTTGHLNMTTVSVTPDLRSIQALAFWFDPQHQVVPRSTVYPPGQSDAKVTQLNDEMFSTSEHNAEVAALRYLHQPVLAVVLGVEPDAAARGVLRVGDTLRTVNGQPVTSAAQVSQLLSRTRPGDKVVVTYQRGTAPATQGVITLGRRPDGSQGFLGILTEDRPANPDQIKIALADVGGPSAGLMFTLAVLDKIAPLDLAGGRFIAGTGTIDPASQVGPIDGIRLKMIGARAQGATVFLVPAPNCPEAAQSPPPGLTLVKVNTLTDAVTALEAIKAGRPAPGC